VNRPLAVRPRTTLDPLRLRSRRTDSGIIGLRTRNSVATKAASRAAEAAPNHGLDLTIAYTPTISAAVTRSAPRTSTPSRRPMPSDSSISARPSTQVTTPIGTLMKKIQCQPIELTIAPPSSSPSVPPLTATNV